MPKITFSNSNNVFFQSLKGSVDNYFRSNKLKKTGNWELYLKTWIMIPGALGLYIFLLSGHYNRITGILTAIFLALTLVGIAFNVMHDACHGSYSGRKWVNNVMGLTMNALGANAFIWKVKHNILHHTYTNIDGLDDDIANGPLLRQCTTQKWMPMHRFQFLYMFILYGISTLSWMLRTDFKWYFTRKINNTRINKIDPGQHLLFWVSKLLYALFYIAVPIYFLGWRPWLAGFLIVHFTMGLTLTVVFQLAHMVEKTSFAIADEAPNVINTEWAIHEVKTTADFATDNRITSWLVGGLNFQIEHHLFPQISHVHYSAISKIVREQCKLFGLPYNCYPSTWQALYSHVRLMKKLGNRN
jgi:linoleoyl-CoA desaturase